MELFNTTGFEIGERVFVDIDAIKYFGVVVDIDDRFKKVKVDFATKSSKLVVEWFNISFWSKEE